jgi:hypothetical protein
MCACGRGVGESERGGGYITRSAGEN